LNDIGATLEQIRIMKGITVTSIAKGSNYSRTNYYKLIRTNDADMMTKTFFAMLDQLTVTLDEFEYIKAHNQLPPFERWTRDMQQAFNNPKFSTTDKVMALQQIKQQAQTEYEGSHITKFRHLVIMVDLFMNRLQASPMGPALKKEAAEISKYLAKVNTWTHYDIVLFSNTMFAIPDAIQTSLLHSVFKNKDNYQDYPALISEIFMFTTNLVILGIQRHQPHQVHDRVMNLKQLTLQPDAALERIILQFCEGLDDYLSKSDLTMTKCTTAIQMTQQLGMPKWTALFNNVLDETKKI